MYIKMPDDIEAELSTTVRKALGEEWQKQVAAVSEKFLDGMKDDLCSYIEYSLGNDLERIIADKAQRLAERFMEHLAEGDDQAVRQFIGDPPGYNGWQRKRDEWTWLPHGQQHGPTALRRKMVDFVRDSLIDERFKDLEAEVEVLREGVQTREAELREWRTGDRFHGRPD